MPVQFTDSTLLQVLLGTGDIVALGKVLDDLLTRPTSGKEFGLGLRETPFDIGHKAIISAAGTELVGVLSILGRISTT